MAQGQQLTFEDWMKEVKAIALEQGMATSDIQLMDHEELFWEELYLKGLDPKSALKQDQSEY